MVHGRSVHSWLLRERPVDCHIQRGFITEAAVYRQKSPSDIIREEIPKAFVYFSCSQQLARRTASSAPVYDRT